MNRVELALRTFFWVLLNKQFRGEIQPYFQKEPLQIPQEEPPPPVEEDKPKRSEAVQLMAMLQREGRLVDFFKEPIDAYTDAQIGAAVRDVHRGCAAVLEKTLGIEPVEEKEEGEKIHITGEFDPEKYRLTGNVTGNPPYDGVLRHRGWKATKCELPIWQGKEESSDVIAPAEMELT
ncbi:hypothetical protein CHISP_2613 [Chitinispirillum alkaliphilum]|nr:hypothetical protein CHISP_2613 [Chitinispirillum alkaliphilum]